MIKNVEHIGIAIRDFDKSESLFERLFGKEAYKEEEVTSEGVKTIFYQFGETKIELLQATNEKSPIAKFIDNKGEGMHHIAFEVDDIRTEMTRLEKEGFVLLNKEPKIGADNKLICFLHPKSTNGVLIEICQEQEA